MTSALQTPRYDQLVRRVGGIIGPGSKVSEALSELFPMIDVENLPPELFILSKTLICHGGGFLAAAVGEAPTAQLFNPANSGKLVTITNVVIACNTTTTFRWGTTATARGAGIGTETIIDLRSLAPDAPVANVREDSAIALPDGTGQTRAIADTSIYLSPKDGLAVLAPGTGFEIGTNGLNSSIFYDFYWRERVGLESEFLLP